MARPDSRQDGSRRLVCHGLKREDEATWCEDETTDTLASPAPRLRQLERHRLD